MKKFFLGVFVFLFIIFGLLGQIKANNNINYEDELQKASNNTEDDYENLKVMYKTHVQNEGWQDYVENGQMSGTTGKSLRLEGIKINIENNYNAGDIIYKVHVQDIGWQEEKKNDELAGTTDQNKRLEAISIRLEGEISNYYDIYYRVHCQSFGWLDWAKNGENAGSAGYGYRLEGIEIQLIEKGKEAPGKTEKTYIQKYLCYNAHVQDIGWQGMKTDEDIAGTQGRGLRVEAIKIQNINFPKNVNIKYQVHVQDIGWQNWKQNGEMAGTEGRGLRIEAIRILLENTDDYSIEYRTHIQDIGWQNWKQDGAISGTVGKSKRIEAIQIRIVKKKFAGKINIETNMNKDFYENINISGWKDTNVKNSGLKFWIDDEEIKNIEYQNREDLELDYYNGIENDKRYFSLSVDTKNFEAGKHNLKIELLDLDNNQILATYTKTINIDKKIHIEYKAHVQKIGWQSCVMDGGLAGTTGKSLNIEALNIKAINLPEGIKLKYQAHVQEIGWQEWVESGNNTGTTGQYKRLEAIKIKLENTDDYSVMYRAHVQDIGWQDWAIDGEMSGTIGVSKGIEAIEIKIVNKIEEKRTKLYLDNIGNISNEVHNLTGWVMTNVPNTTLKLFIDDEPITKNIERKKAQDVYNAIKGYGGEELNPEPRFIVNIDFSKYSLGNHKFKAQVISADNNVIAESVIDFIIRQKIEHYKGIYGITGLKEIGDGNGSNLEYFRFGNGPNVFFATFCVHGFEDNWVHDGYELVDIAHQFYNKLVEKNDFDLSDKWTIYIMQCVNPDGVNVGYTNDGPGRTTLHSDVGTGIDLNRCWSTDFVANYSARNYTGQSPFLAVEARYLRDFMLSHQSTNEQNIVVDLHGWTQQLIGDPVIRNYYRTQFPENTDTPTYGKGYLINWARVNLNNSRSALIELPTNNYSHNDVVNHNLVNRYMEATLSMLNGI